MRRIEATTMTRPDAAYVVLSGTSSRPSPAPLDRRTMRASYCSHRDDAGAVVFDPIYFGVLWDAGARSTLDACCRRKAELGVDAIQLCVQGGYPGYFDGKTFDFRQ